MRVLGGEKMAIKVGISGFGRIGRVVIRAAMDMPEIDGALVGGASLDPLKFIEIVNF